MSNSGKSWLRELSGSLAGTPDLTVLHAFELLWCVPSAQSRRSECCRLLTTLLDQGLPLTLEALGFASELIQTLTAHQERSDNAADLAELCPRIDDAMDSLIDGGVFPVYAYSRPIDPIDLLGPWRGSPSEKD